jgi:hypothetical protein
VRWYPALSVQPTEQSPRDESDLEQAAVDLMTAFSTKREEGAFVSGLACSVSNCEPHKTKVEKDGSPAEWYVEATLTAYALNLAYAAA